MNRNRLVKGLKWKCLVRREEASTSRLKMRRSMQLRKQLPRGYRGCLAKEEARKKFVEECLLKHREGAGLELLEKSN